MKKYGTIIPIVMVILMIISWYSLISSSVEVNLSYNKYLSEARKFADLGQTEYAMNNYNLALEVKSTPEIYEEIANYYKKEKLNENYISWCEDFLTAFPTEAKAYECALDAYAADNDYESFFDVLEIATKRSITSDYIVKISEEYKYKYEFDMHSFDDVGVFANNLSAVKKKDYWGFVSRYGDVIVSCQYTAVGNYREDGMAPVVDAEGNAFFIDMNGSKSMVSAEKFKSFGAYSDGLIPAENTDGKYIFTDENFVKKLGEYDFASSFNEGIAAVKTGTTWKIIKTDGTSISDTEYSDVKIDEKNIAFCAGRAFVQISEDKYIMIDENGEQIGTKTFEDAKPFNSAKDPAAVKIKGKWQYVNVNGEIISKNTYENARSYANGLAAVFENGYWGFIDTEGNIVIEADFVDVKDFTEKGSCFVKVSEDWKLLKIYRLNRK